MVDRTDTLQYKLLKLYRKDARPFFGNASRYAWAMLQTDTDIAKEIKLLKRYDCFKAFVNFELFLFDKVRTQICVSDLKTMLQYRHPTKHCFGFVKQLMKCHPNIFVFICTRVLAQGYEYNTELKTCIHRLFREWQRTAWVHFDCSSRCDADTDFSFSKVLIEFKYGIIPTSSDGLSRLLYFIIRYGNVQVITDELRSFCCRLFDSPLFWDELFHDRFRLLLGDAVARWIFKDDVVSRWSERVSSVVMEKVLKD